MSILLDYLPIIAFFIAYKIAGIYIATAVAMGVLLIQVIYTLCRGQKVATTQWVNLGLLLVLGGATLIFHKAIFIKWKVSVVYWIFGLILFGAQMVGKKSILKSLIGKQFTVPNAIWSKLTYAWAIFFLLMGFINLYVMKHYTTEQWVNFKLFGTLGLMLVFAVSQAIYLNKYITHEPKEADNGEK